MGIQTKTECFGALLASKYNKTKKNLSKYIEIKADERHRCFQNQYIICEQFIYLL